MVPGSLADILSTDCSFERERWVFTVRGSLVTEVVCGICKDSNNQKNVLSQDRKETNTTEQGHRSLGCRYCKQAEKQAKAGSKGNQFDICHYWGGLRKMEKEEVFQQTTKNQSRDRWGKLAGIRWCQQDAEDGTWKRNDYGLWKEYAAVPIKRNPSESSGRKRASEVEPPWYPTNLEKKDLCGALWASRDWPHGFYDQMEGI